MLTRPRRRRATWTALLTLAATCAAAEDARRLPDVSPGRRVLNLTDGWSGPSLSPDGDWLAAVHRTERGNDVVVISLPSSKSLVVETDERTPDVVWQSARQLAVFVPAGATHPRGRGYDTSGRPVPVTCTYAPDDEEDEFDAACRDVGARVADWDEGRVSLLGADVRAVLGERGVILQDSGLDSELADPRWPAWLDPRRGTEMTLAPVTGWVLGAAVAGDDVLVNTGSPDDGSGALWFCRSGCVRVADLDRAVAVLPLTHGDHPLLTTTNGEDMSVLELDERGVRRLDLPRLAYASADEAGRLLAVERKVGATSVVEVYALPQP